MNYTTNYRIQKPICTEKYDVNVYNTNADIIDSALNELEQKNVLQDELLATKKELNDSNKAIENEIQRATEKENEILDNINTNKTIWEDKYTREEIDDKLDDIVIPTKISELENDCNFNSGVKGIKGDNESEYHTEEYVNLTAENVGAIPVFTLENTGKNMINLDTLTDLGLYKIKNAGFDQVVAAGELIACNNLDLFVGGDKDYRYQILLTTGFSEATDNFKFREFYKNNDDSSQEYNISPWKELSGNKTITKADIGLGNVDNTADRTKYVAGILSGNTIPKSEYTFDFSNTLVSSQGKGLLFLNGKTIMLQNLSVDTSSIGAVNKAGDTMTGNLIMKNVALTDGVHSRVVVEMHDDGDGTVNYGSDLVIGAAGNTFIGSGESQGNLRNKIKTGVDYGEIYGAVAERMYISADSDIYLYSNCNNIDNRVGIVYDTSGSLRPLINNTRSLGNAGTKWGNVYATTFHGALDGNASSATKATQDANGNVIANTYAKKDSTITKHADASITGVNQAIIKFDRSKKYLLFIHYVATGDVESYVNAYIVHTNINSGSALTLTEIVSTIKSTNLEIAKFNDYIRVAGKFSNSTIQCYAYLIQ